MMLPRPTQSVQSGFLFVFLGLLALVFSGVSAYASWLIYHKHYIEHQLTGYSLTSFLIATSLGLFGAVSLIYFGLRMAFQTGAYDVHDPKQPNLKF
jgi:TRAP-type C4-dicarboxylate transport system permease small subunit